MRPFLFYFRVPKGLLGLGNQLDFHACILRQSLHCESRTSGERCLEELGIHLVHVAKVGHVGHKYGGLYHICHRQTLCFEDGFGVGEALAGQLFDAALGEIARRGVNGKLATDEYYVSGTDGLAVRADGCGSLV